MNRLPAVRATGEPVIWLSGTFLTFLNKIFGPGVWVVVLGWVVLPVLSREGRLTIRHGFEFMVLAAGLATVFIVWLAWKTQYVGYSGRHLVVAGFWREERIPFRNVEAVEPVWWNSGKMVRIRFRQTTAFGFTVYYLPAWAPIRFFLSSPVEELRNILSTAR